MSFQKSQKSRIRLTFCCVFKNVSVLVAETDALLERAIVDRGKHSDAPLSGFELPGGFRLVLILPERQVQHVRFILSKALLQLLKELRLRELGVILL